MSDMPTFPVAVGQVWVTADGKRREIQKVFSVPGMDAQVYFAAERMVCVVPLYYIVENWTLSVPAETCVQWWKFDAVRYGEWGSWTTSPGFDPRADGVGYTRARMIGTWLKAYKDPTGVFRSEIVEVMT